MSNSCYNYARMSTRPSFPPPTRPPFTGDPYPFFTPFTPYETHPRPSFPPPTRPPFTGNPYPFFTPFTPYETHPAQMMPAQGDPFYGRPQLPPPPVWPYQHANGYNYQKGGGKYNPQVQGVDDISNGGEFNMGPKMGDNSKFIID